MPKIAWDSDALAFLNAAGITDSVIRNAINTYVKDLKSNSLWSRLVALYPFVGGTATTHKYNLKDPRDLDAAFRLVFSGGVTHDANGVTFDGINGYANTKLTPSTSLTLNNESLFLYSRTAAATSTLNEVDMGAAQSTTQRDQLQLRTSGNTAIISINTSGGVASGSSTDARGLTIGSRGASTSINIYKNGSTLISSANSNTGSLSSIPLYIGCRNVNGTASNFVNRNFALAGCGLGFTSSQASTFYALTQTLQTTLSRQV